MTSTTTAPAIISDLPLLMEATEIAAEQEILTSALAELIERLSTGRLDDEARGDIAVDLLTATERFRAFAVRVAS